MFNKALHQTNKTVSEPLVFGAVFTNGKLVPKRVEFWNILQKVQVIELHFLPFISLILIIIDRLILLVALLSI